MIKVEQDIQRELATQREDEDKENDPSEVQEIGSKRKEPSGITESDVHLGALPPTESCDVVRRKIRIFIESGEMKVGEFCNAIGVSNGAYNNFLKKNGPHKGEECAAYFNAFAFFEKRKQEGLKMPKKKQKTSPKKGDEADGGKAGGKEGVKDGSKKVLHADDLSDVHLEGEDTDKVMVFETCDGIRRQISAWLRKPGVTQASLLRDMASQFSEPGKSISASQLQSFRGKKGPEAGNSSAVFYGAYVFFEKVRIKEGKPKSERRKKMEEIWGPKGGFDRTLHASGYVFCASFFRFFKVAMLTG